MRALLRCGNFSMVSYPQNMGRYPYRRQQSFSEGYRLECAFNVRIAKKVIRGRSLQGNGVTALVPQYEPSYLMLNSQPISRPLLTFEEYRSHVTICLRIS